MEFALSALRYAAGMDMPVVRGATFLTLAAVLRASGDPTGARDAPRDARAPYPVKALGLLPARLAAPSPGPG